MLRLLAWDFRRELRAILAVAGGFSALLAFIFWIATTPEKRLRAQRV